MTNTSLNGFSEGNYQLYAVYQPTDSSDWSQIRGTSMLNNYLDITISGITASIATPIFKPDLALAAATQPIGKIYQNKTGRFNVSVINDGVEFYSYLSLFIYSATNPTVNQYINNGMALVKKGDTKSMQLSGTINLAPGLYYAYAVYDSTNTFSKDKYKKVAESFFTPLQFTIYGEPPASDLTLNKLISVAGGNTIYIDKTISLNAEIKNLGGFFDGQVSAYIYPSNDESSLSLGNLNPQTIFIDTDETYTLTQTGSLNLNPGNYVINLYYNDNGWKTFNPYGYSTITVTLLEAPVAIPNTGQGGDKDSVMVYPNPIKDKVYIKFNQAPQVGTLIVVYDLLGKVVLQSMADDKEEFLDLSGNPAGTYYIKIDQENPKIYKIVLL